jgi:hypothetical protein
LDRIGEIGVADFIGSFFKHPNMRGRPLNDFDSALEEGPGRESLAKQLSRFCDHSGRLNFGYNQWLQTEADLE